jgi:hypothetical protein
MVCQTSWVIFGVYMRLAKAVISGSTAQGVCPASGHQQWIRKLYEFETAQTHWVFKQISYEALQKLKKRKQKKIELRCFGGEQIRPRVLRAR